MSDIEYHGKVNVDRNDLYSAIEYGRKLQAILLTLRFMEPHADLAELLWRLGEAEKSDRRKRPRGPILDYIRSRDEMLRKE